VRGIGRWTVEMMLMFRLGRPDVLPVDDLGIRKGLQVVDGLETLPTAREAAVRGEPWGPWRTYAGLYLWRIADQASGKGGRPVPRSRECPGARPPGSGAQRRLRRRMSISTTMPRPLIARASASATASVLEVSPAAQARPAP